MCLSVPGKVVRVTEAFGLRMGVVDFGGVTREACLEHVEADVGDWVLVHAGFALTTLRPDDAEEIVAFVAEGTRALGGEGSDP